MKLGLGPRGTMATATPAAAVSLPSENGNWVSYRVEDGQLSDTSRACRREFCQLRGQAYVTGRNWTQFSWGSRTRSQETSQVGLLLPRCDHGGRHVGFER